MDLEKHVIGTEGLKKHKEGVWNNHTSGMDGMYKDSVNVWNVHRKACKGCRRAKKIV